MAWVGGLWGLPACGEDPRTLHSQQPAAVVADAEAPDSVRGSQGPASQTGAAAAPHDGVAPDPLEELISLQSEPPLDLPSGAGPRFEQAGAAWGLTARNLSGPTPEQGKVFLRDTIGQGLAVLDADGDGLLDLYLPQGHDASGNGRNALYLMRAEGTTRRFEEAAAAFGLDDPGYGFGALAFDPDSDGDDDLLLTNLGPNRLMRNDGGRFSDQTSQHPGLAGDDDAWSAGAAAGDVDGDGDLDLYVANYCAQDLPALQERGLCLFMGCRVPCGPLGLTPQVDRFYRNDGSPAGRLVEDSQASGLHDVEPSYGFQPAFTDVDADGDLDLYVTNDSVFNFLFVNDGSGRFVDAALAAGVACGRRGQMEAGMGLALADVQGDGLPELHVTNFSNQSNSLYANLTVMANEPWFEEQADQRGVGRPSWFRLAWGTSFGDFDNDGQLDLFVANGHIYHHVTGCAPERIVYRQTNDLFRGADGRFVDWGTRAGPGLAQAASHRGSVLMDVDDDLDLDIVAVRIDETPLLLLNTSPEPGHALVLDVRRRLSADGPALLAVGVHATLLAGGRTLVRELQRGSSFLSCEDPRLHFGLGDATRVERLSLRLPGGLSVSLEDLPVDRQLTVILGPGNEVQVLEPER